MEEIISNTKAIELTGEEVHVHFTAGFPYFWLRNDGSSTVLMSLSPNISEGKDGVIEVPAGSSAGTEQGTNNRKQDLYILGNGKVQVMGTESPNNPFKAAQKGGDSGGTSDSTILLNMPFTSDLSDISGFDRTAEYTGSTPLTITADGIFLHYGAVVIDTEFLADVPKFAVEFDVKYEPSGTPNSVNIRKILQIYSQSAWGVSCNITPQYDSSKLNFGSLNNTSVTSIGSTRNGYADENYHHVVISYDSVFNFIYLTVDGNDMIEARFNYGGTDVIGIGSAVNGLNGYVKNFVIKME